MVLWVCYCYYFCWWIDGFVLMFKFKSLLKLEVGLVLEDMRKVYDM